MSDDAVDEWVSDYDYIRGVPDGGLKWVHSLGTYVRQWLDPHKDMLPPNLSETLMYHVPKQFRGKYRPEQLPAEYLPGVKWDVDHDGYVLCTGITMRGTQCRRQAQNRSGYCEQHGGALHPMDRVRWVDPTSGIGERHQVNIRQGRDLEKVGELSRWQQLVMGIISVEDLDDEELSRGQCRGLNGKFNGQPPRMVPRELHDQMMKQLLSRAQQKFREGLLGSIDALNQIAQGDAYEPADRIKAAGMVIDRVMGKTPDVVLTGEAKKPWEEIFGAISRDTNDEDYKFLEGAIDAEVVEDDGADAYQKRFGPPDNPGQHEAPTEVTTPSLDGEPVQPNIGVPPHDPRQQWEKEHPTETKQSLSERIKAGRAKRYAARYYGRDTVRNLPFGLDVKTIVEANEEHDGVYRVKFIPPENFKVPRTVLSKEGRRRSMDR